jgi:hypothetical protein
LPVRVPCQQLLCDDLVEVAGLQRGEDHHHQRPHRGLRVQRHVLAEHRDGDARVRERTPQGRDLADGADQHRATRPRHALQQVRAAELVRDERGLLARGVGDDDAHLGRGLLVRLRPPRLLRRLRRSLVRGDESAVLGRARKTPRDTP